MKGLQFDVHSILGQRAGSAVDLAVVLQEDSVSHLATRVVAPLIEADRKGDAERLVPTVEIDGVRYAIAVHLMTTVPLRSLGRLVASLRHDDRAIKAAIDLLFFGV